MEFDSCSIFKGYEFTIFRRDNPNIPVVFRITKEEFEERKELVIRLDFLIKTNQWIPYAIYEDLFGLPESKYPGLKLIDDMNINYIEFSLKQKKINIY
jgi:hypothetical protein